MLSDEAQRNLSITECSRVEIVIYPTLGGLSHIVVRTHPGSLSLVKHLDSKKMLEVDRLLDQLVNCFRNN